MIDGCGHLSAFWHVIIPLARPGLAACAIYLAILSWSDFVFARTLINDQARWTITTGLVSFVGEHGIDWPALMAAGVLSMIPMVVLFLLLEPFLVSGLTAGSQR
jgi:multiple sugar transport system permease protein